MNTYSKYCAKDIFNANLKNIVKHAQEERAIE